MNVCCIDLKFIEFTSGEFGCNTNAVPELQEQTNSSARVIQLRNPINNRCISPLTRPQHLNWARTPQEGVETSVCYTQSLVQSHLQIPPYIRDETIRSGHKRRTFSATYNTFAIARYLGRQTSETSIVARASSSLKGRLESVAASLKVWCRGTAISDDQGAWMSRYAFLLAHTRFLSHLDANRPTYCRHCVAWLGTGRNNCVLLAIQSRFMLWKGFE